MRVLVTGSHGFIGSQLVKALKQRGDDVIEWDIRHPETPRDVTWQTRAADLDEIYHLACVNQEEAAKWFNEAQNLVVNALSTKKMADLAVRSGARFVYTSTASVYGNPWQIPTPSHHPPTPKSDYAVAKLAGEHFVRNSGADYTIFRLSNVYGPGQSTENPYCGVVAKFLEAARAGKPLQIIGDGSQTRDFTYVEDILPHLMNPELKGILNCSHGFETSITSLAAQIIAQTPESDDRYDKYGIEYVPERPVDGIQRRCLISDVKCPTGLPEGLQRTLEWIESEETASKGASVPQSTF
jgi:UDP-glucose 4-epimerase